MKLAVIVLAHRGPRQVAALLRTLAHPSVGLYLHVDRRADLGPFRTALHDTGVRDVVALPRYASRWGGIEVVDATLAGLRRGFADGCDYFVLVSGQDFPLRPVADIRARFAEVPERSYMASFALPDSRWRFDGRLRTDFYTFTVRGRRETCIPSGVPTGLNWKGTALNWLLRARTSFMPSRRFPACAEPFGGSQWWNLSRDAVAFTLRFLEEHPEYRAYHAHTLLPDEIFFQSILLGTAFASANDIENEALRYMVFPPDASHPRALGPGDLPAMVASDLPFARKIDGEADPAFLRDLVARLAGSGGGPARAGIDAGRWRAMRDDYRALICVTTCERLGHLRRYLPHLARYCVEDARFRLVVALDGTDPDYLAFCERWDIPLVYADAREGVGLSKNRVLERFDDFAYYFFVEDDVELVDGSVFPAHVALHRASGIHHFSLFERGGVRERTGESRIDGTRVVHGMYGPAHFCSYTGEGLRAVGGWHPLFAEYRRWGHTEHSWRFYRAGLAPAPFNVAETLSDTCIWHYPPAVTRVTGVPVDPHQIAAPERELIDQALRHVPLRTLASHHHNGVPPGAPARLADLLSGRDRYPLVEGAERRRCGADFLLWRSRTAEGAMERVAALLGGALLFPTNPALRRRLRALAGASQE